MLIALDVGGTNIRVGFFERKKEMQLLKYKGYKTKDFPSFLEFVRFLLKEEKKNISIISIAAAGPIEKSICTLTNLNWKIDAEVIRKVFKIKHVYILNDLKATALGLEHLTDSDFFIINSGCVNKKDNKCIVSAGTGLGEAFLCEGKKETIAVASEGGHSDFAPINKMQSDLLTFLQTKYGHVSYERILSGPGICNLYDFIKEKKITSDIQSVEKELKISSEPQKIITELALNKKSRTCEMVLELFISIYASEAANAALKYLATSGVFLGGGIAPKIIDFIKKEDFMGSFINKGRFEQLMKKIPVKIILNEKIALLGAWDYAIKN
ncbi:MAG: glucokinase [Parachlamydiales bacterium]|jgi:glucokinase